MRNRVNYSTLELWPILPQPTLSDLECVPIQWNAPNKLLTLILKLRVHTWTQRAMQRCSTYNYNHVNFAKISIKFAHPGSWIICIKKKKEENTVRWARQGAAHCKHIKISLLKDKCIPAKNTAQHSNWQTEKHPESREKPDCFATLSTGETVRKTHFSGYCA